MNGNYDNNYIRYGSNYMGSSYNLAPINNYTNSSSFDTNSCSR